MTTLREIIESNPDTQWTDSAGDCWSKDAILDAFSEDDLDRESYADAFTRHGDNGPFEEIQVRFVGATGYIAGGEYLLRSINLND